LDEARGAGEELAGALTGYAPASHRHSAANATLEHDPK